ncbi:MAG: DoxX family protein [Actinobacteria bacterium]|nr:DoxX family protein [Actinomycetota bacterium]
MSYGPAVSDRDAVNLGLLAFRCAVGAVFLAHGYNHLFRGGRLAGTARWFESLGMRPGKVHALLASWIELGAGALLVLGLLTPVAAAGVIGTMLVAWITNHRGNGFFIFRPGEGWEYVMTLTFCGLLLSVIGAGEWSIDSAINFEAPPGVSGLLTAFVLGAGGAAALLALFWRPPAGE